MNVSGTLRLMRPSAEELEQLTWVKQRTGPLRAIFSEVAMLCSKLPIRGSARKAALFLAVLQMAVCIPCYAAAGLVKIGSQTVITVPEGLGASATVKAKQIQKNVDNSLVAASNRKPSTVKVTYVKGQPVITIGGFLVTAVDTTTAKAAHTTPAALTQKWVSSMRAALASKSNVNSYIAQLTGSAPSPQVSKASSPSPKVAIGSASPSSAGSYGRNGSGGGSQSSSPSYDNQGAAAGSTTPFARARVVFIPAGMVMPMKLNTSLSSQISKPGDVVVATLTEPVNLGDATIPANTMITGRVSKASNGAYLSKSGRLGVKFTSMRTPDGVDTPITAHIVGSIGKFQSVEEGTDVFRGETGETKMKKALVGAAVGAGSGVLLGTTIGAIAGGGRGAGRGAIAGTAIGVGVGVLASYLKKGRDVSVSSEDTIKLQLDQPAKFALASFSPVQNY